jgi:hypothetical protein
MLYRLLFISKAIGIASFWLFAVIVSKPYFMHKGRTFQAACGSFSLLFVRFAVKRLSA